MRIRMNFAKYLEKYKVEWLGILVFTCLCHSSMLLSSSVGIDTEALIADREGLYKGWMLTGRPGLVWLISLLVVDSFTGLPDRKISAVFSHFPAFFLLIRF